MGHHPLQAFLKVTVPLILPGVIVGSLMSFITAINELSGTLAMPVKIYLAVLDGEFGLAAAVSSVHLMSTKLSVYAVFRFADNRGTAFLQRAHED